MSSVSSSSTSRRQAVAFISSGIATTCLPARHALASPVDPRLTPACGRKLTQEEIEGPFFKPRSPERSDLASTVGEGVRLVLAGQVLDACGRPVPGALLDVWQADAAGVYDRQGFVLRGHQFTSADGGYRLRTIAPHWYALGLGGPPRADDPHGAGPPPFGRHPFGTPPFGPSTPPRGGLVGIGPLGRGGPGDRRGPPLGGLRTPHIHVKVQAPGGPLLTTQLYLPSDLTLYGRALQPLNQQDGLFRPDLVIQTGSPMLSDLTGRFDFIIATQS